MRSADAPDSDVRRHSRLIDATHQLSTAASGAAATAEELFATLCLAAAGAVEVDGAGVMSLDGGGLQFVFADPGWVVDVERLQERYGRGPCWDSVRGGHTVAVSDVTVEQQWPELAARAAGAEPGAVPFRAVASLPLLAHGRSWGVLDLYRREPRPWAEADLAVARCCVQMVTAQLVLAAERDRWRQAWEELRHRSSHDELTGLPGRGLLFDRLEHAITAAARRENAVAVLFIDLDDFKAVNDSHGHAVGDATLVEVARRLSLTLRANDTLARLGGDEFVIICEDLAGSEDDVHAWLGRLGERIFRELARPGQEGAPGIDVGVSIGAAVTSAVGGRQGGTAQALTAEALTAQALTDQADQAMYQAKQGGGRRLVISEPVPVSPDGERR